MPERTRPGRSCPLHYHYAPSVFRRPAELHADVLYVVGGLYGNIEALRQVVRMAAEERGDVRLVFNGDFNWFNVDTTGFAEINATVLQHAALRGNVETELAQDDDAYGCGCGYPDWVDDEVVTRSNRIMRVLSDAARFFPELRQRLGRLPMHLVAEVGAARVAIVHGDAVSLAGWSFSHEALSAVDATAALAQRFAEAGVDVFACTHTCLPVAKQLPLRDGRRVVINNGSAGMPNLHGALHGLVTRIATRPTRLASVLGMHVRGVYIDLVRVDYDLQRWLVQFERNWPDGSPAHLSYFERITRGPSFTGPIEV